MKQRVKAIYTLCMIRTLAMRSLMSKMAIVAILLGSLMPAISHLVRAGGGDAWVEVCTALGTKRISADNADPAGSEQAPSPLLHVFEHCPYCSLHMTAMGLPPALPYEAVLAQLGFALPASGLRSPRTSFAWAPAQPRAPPAFS